MLRSILIILAAAVLLTSCSKEKKSCWGCVLVFYKDYVASYRDSMICDKTQSEINVLKRMRFDASDQGFEVYEINKCSRIRK